MKTSVKNLKKNVLLLNIFSSFEYADENKKEEIKKEGIRIYSKIKNTVILNQYRAFQKLLKKGADVNTANNFDETCMIRPVVSSH